MDYINHTIIQKIYKSRHTDSHKGDYGRILCVGGSEDYIGAPYLAASASLAALRSGTDILTVAAPKNVAYAINSLNPDIISKKIDCKYFTLNELDEILTLSDSYDCILIGPGIGEKNETYAFVNEIIKNINKPLVIDADAIKATKLQNLSNSILTPHRKELAIMLKNSNISARNNEELQKHIGTNILLLKNDIDTIISEKEIKYNKTGNPGMTVGGTGDVLAGLVSGFVSQGNSLIDAASAAAYLCGYIGDKLLKNNAYSFIASDFLDEISSSIKEILDKN